MKKKRIAVYLALVLAFTLLCAAHLVPKLTVRAYSYDAAEIGTATLADAGDTVFIRMAKFTFGEGDDAEEIFAPGFVVANAAVGENPAAGIDLTVLTPITPEAPLTGTLDKNIYVCGGDLNDLYLGDLKLAEGRKLYTDGSSLNLLGGKLEADAIETAGFIAIGSADVTVNSDLTGFSGIVLFVSHSEDVKVKGFDTPASLTVNGSVRNTGNYCGAAIDVAFGSAMTVTGDVYTEYPVVIHSTESCGKSAFNVGGSLTVKNSPGWGFQLSFADAVIGGDVKADNWVHLTDNSTLQAKSVTAYLLAATKNSSFTIEEDVTLSDFLDLSVCTEAQSYEIGGNLKCGVFSVSGPAADAKCALHVGGDIEAGQFYLRNTVLDADGDLKKTDGGVFHCEASGIDVAKNVSGTNFELGSCEATIHGNVTVPSGWGCSIKDSTLLIEGDAKIHWLNPFNLSKVTINGTLTQEGLLSLEKGATLTLKSDFSTTTDVGINSESHFIAEKNLTTNNSLFSVRQGSEVTVGGLMTTNRDVGLNDGHLTVNSLITNAFFTLNDGSELTVANDFTANIDVGVNEASAVTVNGNMLSNTGFINVREGSTLLVEKDLTLSEGNHSFDVQGAGTVCTVNGDFNNNGSGMCNALEAGEWNVLGNFTGNGWVGVLSGGRLNVTGDFSQSNWLSPYDHGVVNIGGNVECGGVMEALNGSSVTIGGDLHAKQIGSISGWYSWEVPSTVKVGGSAVSDEYFNVHEGSTMEIGGDFTYNSNAGRLEGDLTVGGDFNNRASRESVFDDAGLLVTGRLNVGGDVNLYNLILNYNDEDENLNVAGLINAYRKADVIKTVDGEYVIEGKNVTENNTGATSYFYTVPFGSQTATFTIDGETYAINLRSHDPKSYTPVKVGAANAVTYELNGGAFKADAVIENSYYTEIGLDLPAENTLEKRAGFLFGGWYDNADFAGDPITEIPEGTTGEVTVYLKWVECDHAASTAQPTCTEGAVCTVCGKEIPANKTAFDDYKAVIKASVKALAKKGDSDAVRRIIADAVAAIDALVYDETKTLDENKAAVDAAADISDALAAQRAADKAAAKAAEAKIAAIGTVKYDNASKQKIDEARAAYNALTADQKALVKNYKTLTAAEKKYADLKTEADKPVGQTGRPHGENCVCYDITGDSLAANIMRFICAFLCFVLAMRTALGV